MRTATIALGSLLLSALGCRAAAPDPAAEPDWSSIGPPSVVEIQETPQGFTFVRNGEPFFVRGVGGHTNLDRLAEFGANAVRTWDAEGIDDLLNEAHARGLAVCVGIWLEHERHGFDYNDPAQKQAQLDKVRRLVTRYREHPAVLSWGVGNEVELGGDLGIALRAIEDAAALIKTLDTNHPTVAIIAEIGEDKARRVAAECPSIDLLGVNSYGGAATVPDRLLEQGYAGPYMITEFGPIGHWEGGSTTWGAPIEAASHQKALVYANSYQKGVAAEHPGRCLGSFAFLWGHKQETTATWFGLLLPTGETTEAVDRLSRFWTGEPLERHAPQVRGISIAGGVDPGALKPDQPFRVTVAASDPDGDPLDVEWVIIAESTDRRSGGDAERAPDAVPGRVVSAEGLAAELRAPTEPGPYRVFVFVRDGTNRAGTANLPILVTP